MEERKIDIACIQETHFDTNDMIEIDNRNIYFAREQNQKRNNKENHNVKAGVAISIRKLYTRNIYTK